MKRTTSPLALAWLSILCPATLGGDKDATPILDKAIAAIGGEMRLHNATVSWSGLGTVKLNGDDSSIKIRTSIAGIDRHRNDFQSDVNGTSIQGYTILDRDKGRRKFGERVFELEGDTLAAAKQWAYLQAIPALVFLLKSGEFQVQAAPDEEVGGTLAAVVKGVGPDGLPFTLFFDKQTGLPRKLTATLSFQGSKIRQEMNFGEYKDFDGVRWATKVEIKRDGQAYVKMDYFDFKVVEKPEADLFASPK